MVNIINVDLIRRVEGVGLWHDIPALTPVKAKMGKTESGALWLNPEKTSLMTLPVLEKRR